MQSNPSPWYAVAPEIIGTVVVIAVVLAINLAISGMLRGRTSLSRETKLRASVFWRNTSLVIAVVLLLVLWRAELRAAALSLAALSVALVLAGKELLTSMLGYIYRTTSGSFRFGDVIEISGHGGIGVMARILTQLRAQYDATLLSARLCPPSARKRA